MKSILFGCIAMLTIAGCKQKPMTIRQFYPFKTNFDTTFSQNKMFVTKFDSFIISNYTETDSTDRIIDSLANLYKDKDYAKYQNYYMSFFKESEYTNEDYIKKNPRSIDRYSQEHDFRYSFVWSNGKFMAMDKFKDGKLVNDKNDIRIEDIPKR